MLYDGVCGLCSRLVHFLLTHDHHAVFMFASLQSATGRAAVERFGSNPNELSSFFVVTNYRAEDARMFSKSGAAIFVARELGWPWKVATLLRILPTAVVDRLYDVVARRRYHLFGRFDHCLTPSPEFRRRFIDA